MAEEQDREIANSPQIHQTLIKIRNNYQKQPLSNSRAKASAGGKGAKLFPWNEVGQKQRHKNRRDGELQDGSLCPEEGGVVKEEEFLCTGKLPHSETRGNCRILESWASGPDLGQNSESCISQPISSSQTPDPDQATELRAKKYTEAQPAHNVGPRCQKSTQTFGVQRVGPGC